MNEIKYNSQANGVLIAVALGTSTANQKWCFVDDKGYFYDTESYKQDTPFTSANKIQQIAVLAGTPSSAINLPQTFTTSSTGLSSTQNLMLTTSSGLNEVWWFNTNVFSSVIPSNGDTVTLTTDHVSNPTTDTTRATHINFTMKQCDLPSDVTSNYNQPGSYHIYQNLLISLNGSLKTGDTLTVRRSKHTPTDTVFTIQHDTTGMASYFGMQADEELSLIYQHKDGNTTPTPTPTPSTVTYTSSDSHITWLNPTTPAGTGQTNTIQFDTGYCVDSSPADFNIDVTYKDGTAKSFPYELPANYQGKTYANQKLNLPDLTNATNVNIPNQSKPIPVDLTLNVQNCDIITPQPVTDSAGKVHYYVDFDHRTITIKAHDGYIFTTDGNIKYTEYGNVYGQTTIPLTANNSDTITATLPVNFNPQSPITVTIGATKPDIVQDTGGFVNFYKADYPSLISFSNDWISNFGGNGNINIYDVASYISNLIMLPLEIPSTLINSPSAIVAGNQTYKTTMPTVDSRHYVYDLGSITTPEVYKNGYDYYQVKTRLVLPFTDTVDLDPIHVINQTITIKYDVNFQNGDTTVIVANDSGVFFNKTFNIANEIPFVTASTNGSQYQVINKLQERFNNDVHQAYVLIEQPTPVLNSDYYKTIERGQLKAYTGNVKVELLNNTDIPYNDLATIQNLLRNGVKIK